MKNSGNSFQLGIFGSFIQISHAALYKEGTRGKNLRVQQGVVGDGGRSGTVPGRCSVSSPLLSSPLALKATLFQAIQQGAPSPSWGQMDGSEHEGGKRRVHEAPAYPA